MGIHMNVLIQYLLLFVLQYTETAPRVGILNIKIQYSRFNIQDSIFRRAPRVGILHIKIQYSEGLQAAQEWTNRTLVDHGRFDV